MKIKSIILIVIFFLFIAAIFKLKSTTPNSKISVETIETSNKKYSTIPGNVANVFGWGYNRTSCYIKNIDDTIVFFYAEDQHIYYTFHSNPDRYWIVENTPVSQNPDFDVVCDNSNIYITISDVNQQYIYLLSGIVKDTSLSISNSELVYDGKSAYNAVAPHMRIYNKIPHIVFMEYGRTGSNSPNSKVFVAKKSSNKNWDITTLFEYPADVGQVLGISLERYNNSLITFINPPGKNELYVSVLQNGKWTDPISHPIMDPAGQLEWQSIARKDQSVDLVFLNSKGNTEYIKIANDQLTSIQLPEYSASSGSLLITPQDKVFFLYNNGILRQILSDGISTKISIPHITSDRGYLYFLRTPEIIENRVDIVWLEGMDGAHSINYKSFDINEYSNQLTIKDESLVTIQEPLVISSEFIN